MNKKDYIIKQLARAKNKKYEAYVVHRIVHLLNNLSIKFITQQYVTRPEGRALTDLFFPQIELHIEVDEPFHQANIEQDKIREADIINATNHKILRVDVSCSISEINDSIDSIVAEIKKHVEKKKEEDSFTAWDFDAEFNPETYIKKGHIDISDNAALRTSQDVCNCFGHDYKDWRKASALHPHDDDTILWFPKLFPNGKWLNQISDDEEIITERNEDDEEARKHVEKHLINTEENKHQRIVFAKVKDNLGSVLYRFRGFYKLDITESNKEIGLVWKRAATRVATFPHK